MSLSVGIVGLPNAGKSTLFNALVARRQAPVGVHPFTTVAPNTGVVRVPDARLVRLAKLLGPEKTTPTSVTFIDIAGLVKGAHTGEGLGNEFLAHIRGVDAIAHVVREFADPRVAHVMGAVDPLRDRDTVLTELILKDLETLERAKEGRLADTLLGSTVEKLLVALNAGTLAAAASLTRDEEQAIRQLQLLTRKPIFHVLNVAEEDLEELKDEVRKLAGKLGECVIVSARLEEELTDLSETERAAYRHEVGLRGSGLDRVIAKGYEILDLVTFYTVKGVAAGRGEIRAWAVPRGTTLLAAAEIVHTDFAKGFIKAEAAPVEVLLDAGGWQEAKVRGKIRTEGREALVRDGDVIELVTGVRSPSTSSG